MILVVWNKSKEFNRDLRSQGFCSLYFGTVAHSYNHIFRNFFFYFCSNKTDFIFFKRHEEFLRFQLFVVLNTLRKIFCVAFSGEKSNFFA